MILGIDGGATATKALLLGAADKVIGRSRGAPSNAILQTEDELYVVLKTLWEDLAPHAEELQAVALCLAGVANEKAERKVEAVARLIWPHVPLFVSHDLRSGLYAGAPTGEGVVVISGTGASVFARRASKELRGGGWGHVLGDAGSGYHIAHMALRNITAHYDRQGKHGALGRRILRATASKTLEDLAAFISRTEKPRIAELSENVFREALRGDVESNKILQIAARALASNVTAISGRLGGRRLPILLTGGVFEKQKIYRDLFARELRKDLSWARPELIADEASLGAARWGRECLLKAKRSAKKRLIRNSASSDLATLLKNVKIDEISTEENNPRTRQLSVLPIAQAVELFLNEDAAILPALHQASPRITRAVELAAASLKSGGRLIYAGAGTSGRLGVLDASECPPTFRSTPGQVVGLIAGGALALQEAVEGAEDDAPAAKRTLKDLKLGARDCLVGIAASGRTPYVLGALEYAKSVGAATVFLTCNAKLAQTPSSRADVEIHLATGPEVLTGSTRLKSGTATKMVLNIISTLAMVQLGKVVGNDMVDLHPSNDKLKVRALKIYMGLTGDDVKVAYAALFESNWHLRMALQSSGKSHLCQPGLPAKTSR
jgi:N-acetylmuramic acid 6-phosphate etherase